MAFGLGVLGEESDFSREIGRILEDLVDAREAQIRNLVEFPQPFQHLAANSLAQDDIVPFGPSPILNSRGELPNCSIINRTVLTRGAYTGGDLLTVEWNSIT